MHKLRKIILLRFNIISEKPLDTYIILDMSIVYLASYHIEINQGLLSKIKLLWASRVHDVIKNFSSNILSKGYFGHLVHLKIKASSSLISSNNSLDYGYHKIM